MQKALFLSALLFACGGDDNQNADGGEDATTKDVAPEGASKDATTDAKADVASDAPTESASDAGTDVIIADAPADVAADATGCDGGCTKFSFYCSNAVQPCQCVGLAYGEKAPVCDAAAANCLVDPCNTKTVSCINDQCVIQ